MPRNKAFLFVAQANTSYLGINQFVERRLELRQQSEIDINDSTTKDRCKRGDLPRYRDKGADSNTLQTV
jgi:hypothetical protein